MSNISNILYPIIRISKQSQKYQKCLQQTNAKNIKIQTVVC